MNRPTLISAVLAIGLVLLTTSVSAKEFDPDAAVKGDTQPNQFEILDHLLQAGLISDALYARRLALLTNSVTHENRLTVQVQSQTERAIALSETESERYVALVIGSNNYIHFEPLETAINDAQEIGAILQNKFGFEVQLLENPGRHELIGALAAWRKKLTVNDNFLLFYAGHGYLDSDARRGYWLPVDAEPNNPSNWVSTIEISDALLTLPVRHGIVIADSCFAGSLAGRSRNSNDYPLNNDNPELTTTMSRTAITSGGLEPVLDTIDGKHSVFASALLNQLNHYRQVTSTQSLFEQILIAVKRHADQTPEYFALPDAGHLSGEFSFPPAK